MNVILETARLSLRELVPDDLDFVAEMLADPEVMRYYPKTYNRCEAQGCMSHQIEKYRRDGYGLWRVSFLGSPEPVGLVGLVRQEVEGETFHEIGYLIHRPYWQRGYATEAALGVRRFAFEVRGLPHVVSLVRPENVPSVAVAKKLGMTPEREIRFGGFMHMVYGVAAGAVSAGDRTA
ncbi:MAG TPA: GNAT family N-acetyltransferase [Thermoanaerobaculia bacterium]|nr:GNAT family N-acetyltransferase [Thermoanaerobaculia bacterium]